MFIREGTCNGEPRFNRGDHLCLTVPKNVNCLRSLECWLGAPLFGALSLALALCSVSEAHQVFNLFGTGEHRHRHDLRCRFQYKRSKLGLSAAVRVVCTEVSNVDVHSILCGVRSWLVYKSYIRNVEETIYPVLYPVLRREALVQHSRILLAVRRAILPHDGTSRSRSETKIEDTEEGVTRVPLRKVIEVHKNGSRPELTVVMF
mmetsp:Transcript_50640/g.134883  ORF Transcript_50640/g.134883 Transcript_50640/m.134883 type:complete len:204 (+) Transcript_50640:496-1107(+)